MCDARAVGAYGTEGWSDFFVAAAGASAALAGLLFIGISINLGRILEINGLPSRAALSLMVLANAMVVSLTLLGPNRTGTGLGVLVLLVGGLGWIGTSVVLWHGRAVETARHHGLRWLISTELATLPFIVGGISLIAGAGGGLYWVQAGVIVSVAVGLLNAWVLLVEILR